MFNQIESNETNICNVLFAHSARAIFGFQYFNQFLKFLQIFRVFNILWHHGPYLWSWELDRLCAIVCCFYVFHPELTDLRTDIIVWLLKVNYILLYFR